MPPFNGGGEMIREVSEDRITYGDPPYKFEAGTPPIVQAIGLGAALDYIASVGKARIRDHEAGLVRYAHERLREINSLRIFGTAKDKGPIVSFEIKGAHPHDVATIIDRSGVAVRAGTHCVMPLLARFGVTATCRASFAMYNTREEVDCLAQALVKAQGFLRMIEWLYWYEEAAKYKEQALAAEDADAQREFLELAEICVDVAARAEERATSG